MEERIEERNPFVEKNEIYKIHMIGLLNKIIEKGIETSNLKRCENGNIEITEKGERNKCTGVKLKDNGLVQNVCLDWKVIGSDPLIHYMRLFIEKERPSPIFLNVK